MIMAQQEARLALLPANALKGKRLGISASDSPDLGRLGVSEAQFRITLGELARTVVNAGGDLFYGGHLQPDGLTRVLLKELERYGRDDRPLKVCLSWTVHRKMTAEQLRLQQKIAGAYGEICCLGLGGQPMKAPSEEPPIAEFTAEESATALSNLRAYITANTDARIVIGGQQAGFQGVMPGILEEILFSLENRKPLYLAGGFGGATLDAIRALRPADAEWLPALPNATEPDPRLLHALGRLRQVVETTDFDGYDNGLTKDENQLLAASYRPSEIAALIGRGMGRLLRN
jgi:hypothetical protein